MLKSRRLQEAEAVLRQALHHQPRSAHAHYNLGTVLWRQGRPDEAVVSYQLALREKPDYVDAHLDLGNVYKDQGRLDEAIAAYRTGLHHKPDAAYVHSNLVQTLLYHRAYGAEAILEESRRWNEQHAQPLVNFTRAHTNNTQEDRRLRVGYVSSDFRDHVDSYFTVPLFSNHDHRQFEIFCFSGVTQPDELTQRNRGYADCSRSTVRLGDQEMAELIRADEIDILVDLKMHGHDNRLRVFARKPAPVQVAWLGYPGTTGLNAMDYRLTDPHLDPPGQFDAYYSEESIRLPETFWCYDPLTEGPPVSSLPAARNRFITFGCLNSFTKVNDGCLSLWAQVLRAVPGSRFLLRAPLQPGATACIVKTRIRGNCGIACGIHRHAIASRILESLQSHRYRPGPVAVRWAYDESRCLLDGRADDHPGGQNGGWTRRLEPIAQPGSRRAGGGNTRAIRDRVGELANIYPGLQSCGRRYESECGNRRS